MLKNFLLTENLKPFTFIFIYIKTVSFTQVKQKQICFFEKSNPCVNFLQSVEPMAMNSMKGLQLSLPNLILFSSYDIKLI